MWFCYFYKISTVWIYKFIAFLNWNLYLHLSEYLHPPLRTGLASDGKSNVMSWGGLDTWQDPEQVRFSGQQDAAPARTACGRGRHDHAPAPKVGREDPPGPSSWPPAAFSCPTVRNCTPSSQLLQPGESPVRSTATACILGLNIFWGPLNFSSYTGICQCGIGSNPLLWRLWIFSWCSCSGSHTWAETHTPVNKELAPRTTLNCWPS